MKKIAELLWAVVPNKGMVLFTIAIVCVTMVFGLALSTYVAFNFEVRGKETIANVLHGHVERLPLFNATSIDSQTDMIAILDDKGRDALTLNELRREYRDHERDLYMLLDDNDNFKSDLKRRRWEKHDDEIKKDIDRLERRIRGYESSFSAQMMIATRDR